MKSMCSSISDAVMMLVISASQHYGAQTARVHESHCSNWYVCEIMYFLSLVSSTKLSSVCSWVQVCLCNEACRKRSSGTPTPTRRTSKCEAGGKWMERKMPLAVCFCLMWEISLQMGSENDYHMGPQWFMGFAGVGCFNSSNSTCHQQRLITLWCEARYEGVFSLLEKFHFESMLKWNVFCGGVMTQQCIFNVFSRFICR